MTGTRGPSDVPLVSVVVPTIGRSPWLTACLTALRDQTGVGAVEILLVDQSDVPVQLAAGLADRVLRPPRNLGFAGGTNLGLAASRGEFLATVNDDAVVAPDWLARLTTALLEDPMTAAAQGANLKLTAAADAYDASREPAAAPAEGTAPLSAELDGCGLGWNSWWQAIQIGHGKTCEEVAGLARAMHEDRVLEVFGVSATAALYRRSALRAVSQAGEFFDSRLSSYYEDAELAGRLRGAGFRAVLVPRAVARHGGSVSGSITSRERWTLIYGNRYLAAARLLGRGFWPRLPAMVCRDLADLLSQRRESWRSRSQRLLGTVLGWARAARRLPAFARGGAPATPIARITELSRLPVEPG